MESNGRYTYADTCLRIETVETVAAEQIDAAVAALQRALLIAPQKAQRVAQRERVVVVPLRVALAAGALLLWVGSNRSVMSTKGDSTHAYKKAEKYNHYQT